MAHVKYFAFLTITKKCSEKITLDFVFDDMKKVFHSIFKMYSEKIFKLLSIKKNYK